MLRKLLPEGIGRKSIVFLTIMGSRHTLMYAIYLSVCVCVHIFPWPFHQTLLLISFETTSRVSKLAK